MSRCPLIVSCQSHPSPQAALKRQRHSTGWSFPTFSAVNPSSVKTLSDIFHINLDWWLTLQQEQSLQVVEQLQELQELWEKYQCGSKVKMLIHRILESFPYIVRNGVEWSRDELTRETFWCWESWDWKSSKSYKDGCFLGVLILLMNVVMARNRKSKRQLVLL